MPTDKEIIEIELNKWLEGKKRREMLSAEQYYMGKQDILRTERFSLNGNSGKIPLKFLPNNKIVDNQFALQADCKANYLLGKPFTVDYIAKNARENALEEIIQGYFDADFHQTFKESYLDAVLGQISYIMPYYDKHGNLRIRGFKSFEILPFWADSAQRELEMAVYYHAQVTFEGKKRKILELVDVLYPDRVEFYIYERGELIPDIARGVQANYIYLGNDGYSWGKIPLIPLKYGSREATLFSQIKSLQDAINKMRSDYLNNMENDCWTTILVLENYDGADLAEFRQNLASFGAVKVRTIDGVKGSVSTLSLDVNADNYEKIINSLTEALIRDMRGFDTNANAKLGSAPNEMNIQSMYSGLDLDANGTEPFLRCALCDFLEYVRRDMRFRKAIDFDPTRVKFVFNKDVMFNESTVIDNIIKSRGLVSDRTLLTCHPYVNNVLEEV